MPELQEERAPGSVHGARDLAPALDMLGRKDRRHAREAGAAGHGIGPLGDHQPGRGALGVVEGVELGGRAGRRRTRARHRRHDEAVLQPQPLHLEGLEEDRKVLAHGILI